MKFAADTSQRTSLEGLSAVEKGVAGDELEGMLFEHCRTRRHSHKEILDMVGSE